MTKEQQMAASILKNIGGQENLYKIMHCQTRLRLTVNTKEKVDMEGLRSINGVLGVVDDDTLQIVVGPGTVNRVAASLSSLTGLNIGEENNPDDLSLEERAAINKQEIKNRSKKTPIKQLLKKIGNIFIPLIPGLVASGLINGIANFSINAGADPKSTLLSIMVVIGSSLFTFLAILVGWNTAKEFNGTPVLGAIMGMILFNPALANLTIYGEALTPGRGGLFGVIFAAWLITLIEKQVRKGVPNSLDIIITPLISLLTVGLLSLYAIQPLFGVFTDAITNGIQSILNIGGIVAGALLSGFFLPLVMVGLHQGLTPIHLDLIHQFGYTSLLPVLAMAGAGQVGAAIAVYVKTKNKKLRNNIKGGLPVGFLGIGEPLLYGVTLPLGRPFITACIGAAFGGAFQAVMHTGALGIGVSGLSLIPLIAQNKYVYYFIGLIIAYAAGFILTYLFGYNEKMAENIK
ncbi:PTS transporter subunit EIIC [Sporolactobacillus terrae]|uniref:PTS sugar transporter subunit IIC n=1 Tax=Sporolactobacillus terrae TaxID=269673 RepID=A0ABX5Q946_9BACL|nr:PTS transporter subunit EIIC [Sporolactobacillus terrae]QAA23127.1 PTS sugar transporter subunit IIC [Sporolactobacillus terrae]QAA26097.1 PTS sugar transporter subunit IIC [Sporolactobacillus terrae]UAK15190.1 PTS transporter subunit EIIC [Sporolactobacillus terrae]